MAKSPKKTEASRKKVGSKSPKKTEASRKKVGLKFPKKTEASRKKVGSNQSRMLIEEQTAAFLNSGGKITKIPTGTSGVTSGNKKSPSPTTLGTDSKNVKAP